MNGDVIKWRSLPNVLIGRTSVEKPRALLEERYMLLLKQEASLEDLEQQGRLSECGTLLLLNRDGTERALPGGRLSSERIKLQVACL